MDVAGICSSIEAAHLRKSYGARLAVDDLTFSVNAGEVVGLLGPNGVLRGMCS
jgi:ABC-type multidrug transport system ATPase subunit